MTENTASAEPVTEEVVSSEQVTPETTAPEPTEDERYSDIYDKLTSEDQPDEPEPETAKPEQPEPEKAEEQADPAPPHVPREVKESWSQLPENVREAISRSHREMSQKNAEMGRQVQATKPLYDRLVQAAKENPQLAQMTPDQIAQDAFSLAQVNAQIQQDPARAVMGLIQKYELGPVIAQAMGQQANQTPQQVNALQQHVQRLEQRLAQVGDPQFLEQQYSQFATKQQTLTEVEKFAQTADHWSDVEADIPAFIEPARKAVGDGASNADILSKAYDLATYAKGLVAKPAAGDEPAVKADPKKAEAVKKATAVNVKSAPSGNPRELSEDDRLAAVYDRAINA